MKVQLQRARDSKDLSELGIEAHCLFQQGISETRGDMNELSVGNMREVREMTLLVYERNIGQRNRTDKMLALHPADYPWHQIWFPKPCWGDPCHVWPTPPPPPPSPKKLPQVGMWPIPQQHISHKIKRKVATPLVSRKLKVCKAAEKAQGTHL